MRRSSGSMNGITPPMTTRTVGSGRSALVRGKASSSEQSELMPPLFGASSSTTADRPASTVRSSVRKVHIKRVSLSDRLTQSLITVGLVRGITPTLSRKRLQEPVRVIVSFGPVGVGAGGPEAGN